MSEGYFGEVDQANFSGAPTDTLGLQDLMEIKKQIGGISALPLETHSEEFEVIHNSLNRVLSSIDGI